MSSNSRANVSIVFGGRRRVARVMRRDIREQVRREWAERVAEAGFLSRIVLRVRIAREVNRRLRRQLPPGSLFSKTR